MTNDELRELDAWIAEHVMGCVVVIGSSAPRHKQLPPYQPQDILDYGAWTGGMVRKVKDWTPTISADDAMRVLEKCAKKLDGSLIEIDAAGGKFSVSLRSNGTVSGFKQSTLELAICLFARKLFEK